MVHISKYEEEIKETIDDNTKEMISFILDFILIYAKLLFYPKYRNLKGYFRSNIFSFFKDMHDERKILTLMKKIITISLQKQKLNNEDATVLFDEILDELDEYYFQRFNEYDNIFKTYEECIGFDANSVHFIIRRQSIPIDKNTIVKRLEPLKN